MPYLFYDKDKTHEELKRQVINRNQKIFLGHCYSCNNFGHKALKCKAYEKVHEYKKDEITKPKARNHNQFGPIQRFDIECYKCNNFGHLARNCKLKCDAPIEFRDSGRKWQLGNRETKDLPWIKKNFMVIVITVVSLVTRWLTAKSGEKIKGCKGNRTPT